MHTLWFLVAMRYPALDLGTLVVNDPWSLSLDAYGMQAASRSTEKLAEDKEIAVILVAYHAGGKGLTLVQGGTY